MNGTSAFLAKYVAAALEPYACVLPSLYVFHVGVGWGDKTHTVVPFLLHVNDRVRPPMVWLLGPLPLSPLARRAVVDIFAYLFDREYSVRWTSHCVHDVNQTDVEVHRSVFSILACRDDASVHCVAPLYFEPVVDFVQYNNAHGIADPSVTAEVDVSEASRMQKNAISTMQMRAIFQRLLGGEVESLQGGSVYSRFFVPTHFLSIALNDPSCLLAGDGYGSSGDFGLICVRNVCMRNDVDARAHWSVSTANWMNSIKNEPRVRTRSEETQCRQKNSKKIKSGT